MKNVKLSKKNVKVVNKVEKRREDVDYTIINKVAMKALKVVATSGDKKALDVLFYCKTKKLDDYEDLVQEVALAIVENGYILKDSLVIKKHSFKLKKEVDGFSFITKVSKKNSFKVVRKAIYRLAKEELNCYSYNVLADEENEFIEVLSYNKYIVDDTSYKLAKKAKFNLDELGLTNRQKEILQMYASLKSINKVAELLHISKQAVSKTINVIREKVN